MNNLIKFLNLQLRIGGNQLFAIVSGNADNGTEASAFYLNANNDSTNSNTNIGGSLPIKKLVDLAIPLGKTFDATKGRLVDLQPVGPKIAEAL